MAQFIQEHSHSNIIIVNIPPRHDIVNNSITNLEIQATNRKLNRITKAYNNVTIVENNLHRKYITRHWIHLNKHGKEWLSKQIDTQIHRQVESNSKDTPIIPLTWKIEPISKQISANPLLEQTITGSVNPNKLNGSVTVETSTYITPNRNRRYSSNQN